jgi:RraA family protein
VLDRSCNIPPELKALSEAFASTATPIISDNLERMPGAVGVRPFHRVEGTMAGIALTVRVANGDNKAIHQALELVAEGHILVVDAGGDVSRAVLGEIMSAIARSRGAAGVVIDGAIRDVGIINADSFPVFAKAAIHRGPFKNGPGEIGVPVSVGGMLVNPGDIVVGDADGVVAFSPAIADTLLEACRKQEAKEAEILATIRDGTYRGAYAEHG